MGERTAATGRGFAVGVVCRGMGDTIGYHLVKSGYGLWLPGDERGHWSEAWDEQIGFFEPHTLHHGDPARRRMAHERMAHQAVRLSQSMIDVVADTLGQLIGQSRGGLAVAAAAIEPTHMHLLLPYTARDIDGTARWITDQTTKAIHRRTPHQGPVWAKGRWRVYIFTVEQWQTTTQYIRRHNTRHGRPADPYPWITPIPM